MEINVIGTIVDYAETETASFSDKPMNEVDTLILAWLSYLSLPDRYRKELASERWKLSFLLAQSDVRGMTKRMFDPRKSLRLLTALSNSPRYREVVWKEIRERESVKTKLQYGSALFFLPDGKAVLSFRGTDGTVNGWNEDLDMCFLFPVESQKIASKVAEETLASVCDRPFVFTGHSKGGNLAVFAAATLPAPFQDRVLSVHSHDGPGFLGDFSSSAPYRRIQDKIVKNIPQSSVFGLLLDETGRYRIVRSNGFLIYQHSPFNWLVDLKGSSFLSSLSLSRSATLFQGAARRWMEGFPPQERARAVRMLFSAILRQGIKTVAELKRSFPKVLLSFRKLSPSDRAFASKVFLSFGKVFYGAYKDERAWKKREQQKNQALSELGARSNLKRRISRRRRKNSSS